MNSYVTTTEMVNYWSHWNDTNYSSDEKTNALEASYGLVNSYIAPGVKVPTLQAFDPQAETIEAPAVLKYSQANFARCILMQQDLGNTSYVQELWDATVEILRGIQEGDLLVEGGQYGDDSIGWVVAVASSAGGKIHIKNETTYPHDYPVSYVLEIDSVGDDLYPYSSANTSSYATFKIKEYGSSAWASTEQLAENRWKVVGVHGLTILFEGKFDNGDTWTIRGIPEQYKNINTDDTQIRSAKLSYR